MNNIKKSDTLEVQYIQKAKRVLKKQTMDFNQIKPKFKQKHKHTYKTSIICFSVNYIKQ